MKKNKSRGGYYPPAIGKRILCLITVLSMLTAFMPSASAEVVERGTCGENLTWKFDSNGTLTISGTGAMDDYAVTDGEDFSNMPWRSLIENIKSVVVENGVTRIGNYAFYSFYNLVNVTLPDSITVIGGHAFTQCENLVSIIIPDSVTAIQSGAFSYSGLKSMIWSENITSIEEYTFSNCSDLISITIPDSVTTIGEFAFYRCLGLTDINVNSKNQFFCSVDGSLFSKDKTVLIQYATGKKDSEYRIPDSVTKVDKFSFAGCKNLTKIIIPNSVISIGSNSFRWCENITTVLMGNNITSIEHAAFSDCKNLNNVTIPKSIVDIATAAFGYCKNLTDVYYSGTANQWNNIKIDSYNEPLQNANIHFETAIIIPTPTPAPKYFTVSGSRVTNTADTAQTATIITAQYSGNRLTDVKSQEVTFVANETKAFTVPTGGKLFVWDSVSGMRSLVK